MPKLVPEYGFIERNCLCFGVVCFGFIFAIRLKRGTVYVLSVSTFGGVGKRRRFCATLLQCSVAVFVGVDGVGARGKITNKK